MANETVLVIEDNEMNMKLARSLLQLGKYSVLEASDAENGIQLAREHHPDLILMDIQLPGMDGLTATREIKNDPAVKDISIVALTSYAMQGDEEKARDAGCIGYIAKPIDTRSFLQTVGQFLV
jgi:CheY-like chemotaxis protein